LALAFLTARFLTAFFATFLAAGAGVSTASTTTGAALDAVFLRAGAFFLAGVSSDAAFAADDLLEIFLLMTTPYTKASTADSPTTTPPGSPGRLRVDGHTRSQCTLRAR
jgi:hypothetical protein